MTLEQTTFLGASIRSFNSSIGWGSQPSSLDVELVEDPDNDPPDSFTPGTVGEPKFFNYQGWKFGGILQSSTIKYGQDGNPVQSVHLEDPRELLDGVQLILQDYHGSTPANFGSTESMFNVYNIYAYLENTLGFGNSGANDTGVPWQLIRNAFYNMQRMEETTISHGPIRFRGYSYYCDPFWGNDILPYYYRVGGDSISLLGFIQEICEVASQDFFVTLTESRRTGRPNRIRINLVGRKEPPRTGAINEFVEATEGAVTKEQGYELRNEVNSKFVVGGQQETLYYQEWTGYGNDVPNYNTYWDNTILPYWGDDCNDKLIIQNGINFVLDGRPLFQNLGQKHLGWVINYPTDIHEMRAALGGQDCWELFLSLNDYRGSRHYKKAESLYILGWDKGGLIDFLKEAKRTGDLNKKFRHVNLAAMSKETNSSALNYSFPNDRKKIVYDFVNHYATEYFGKKFMVMIPFVLAQTVSGTNEIKYSLEPTDSGYVDEDRWSTIIGIGYQPQNIEKFTTEDNKIKGYVKFVGLENMFDYDGIQSPFDTSNISPDSMIRDDYPGGYPGKMLENLFVQCEIDPKPVFMDKATLFSPRAVITLPGAVMAKEDTTGTLGNFMFDQIRFFLNDDPENVIEQARIEDFINELRSQFGSEHSWFTSVKWPIIPGLAVVPLRSNILTYGPWYASGRSGRVEYNKDDSMVPWNYGGYDAMNVAGWAKVDDATSEYQIAEKGSLEFPGVPEKALGDLLLENGPAITDISVSVGEGGVTTSYRMSTWTKQFGRWQKYNADRVTRLSKLFQDNRKQMRKLIGEKPPLRLQPKEVSWVRKNIPQYLDRNTSPGLLVGDVIPVGSGDSLEVITNVSAIAPYKIQSQVDNASYTKQAGMSLDGMFVPFTTDPNVSYENFLPHFETPSVGAASPTVDELNPFGDKGIAMAFPEGATMSESLNTELTSYNGHVKGIGLQAPIIVGGWGFDISGNPVPSDPEDEEAFLDNYKRRADQWKVGPLDIKWDYNRKVWSIIGSQLKPKCVFTLLDTLSVEDSMGSGDISVQYGFGTDHTEDTNITLYNLPKQSGDYEFYGDAGDYGIASYDPDGSGWRIDMMECP